MISKVYLAGEEGSPLTSVTGGPVDIWEIRRRYNSVNLFVDPDFPANSKSIGAVGGDAAARSGPADAGAKYEWLRPHAISTALGVKQPQFALVQDAGCSDKLFSEYDMTQGALGDCWYMAALQALTGDQEQIKFIIPEDNITGFDDEHYCGTFHFRFFCLLDNKWIDIVVDDQLPVTAWGDSWRLAFAKASPKWANGTETEFWAPLIEKAYAKLIGSYAKIEAGYSSQALENFTNGFAEIIDFSDNDTIYNLATESERLLSLEQVIKRRIQDFVRQGKFMGIGNDSKEDVHKAGHLDGFSDYVDRVGEDGSIEHAIYGYKYDEPSGGIVTDHSRRGLGLVCPHAYTILDAREVACKDGSGAFFLLKIRNPHATHEWMGQFSEQDDGNWARLTEDLRRRAADGSACIDDGVFWMLLSDALKYFRSLEACSYGKALKARMSYARGAWPAWHQRVGITTDLTNCLKYCTAYKFEARRETEDSNLAPAFEGKCVVAVTIVLGGYYSGMKPLPRFNYALYKDSTQ